MATYVALTSHDGGATRWIVEYGREDEGREALRSRAEDTIVGAEAGAPRDMLMDTELKNLIVLPLSTVKRRYAAVLEAFYDEWIEEMHDYDDPTR